MAAAGNTQCRPQFTWLGIERKEKERPGIPVFPSRTHLQFIKNSHCGLGDAHLVKCFLGKQEDLIPHPQQLRESQDVVAPCL